MYLLMSWKGRSHEEYCFISEQIGKHLEICHVGRRRTRLGLRDFSSFKKTEIHDYENVIFGSGIYMRKMRGIRKVLDWFKDKPIMIFACGGNNNVEKDIEVIRKDNFTEEQLSFHLFFYVPGGVDFSKVGGFYKYVMKLVRRIMMNKKDKTKEEMAILDGFDHPTDFVDKRHIGEIISYVKRNNEANN